MRLIIVGPGRAGMSIALAAHRAGLDVVGLLGRHGVAAQASLVAAEVLDWDSALPAADLVLITVKDDAIAPVCELLAPLTTVPMVHASGLAALDVLAASRGGTGSFHPLQTLPSPDVGAGRLAGAGVAIAASDVDVEGTLQKLAEYLGMEPFSLAEESRALYHAAAAAASNFVVTALALSHQLFEAAGVDPSLARPLTEAVVANSYSLGPAAAMTGPVARGDVGTVAAQLAAVAAGTPELLPGFRSMVLETSRVVGTDDLFAELVAD